MTARDTCKRDNNNPAPGSRGHRASCVKKLRIDLIFDRNSRKQTCVWYPMYIYTVPGVDHP